MKVFLTRYLWRIVGVTAGLALAVFWLTVGFWATLLVLICMGLGYFIGISFERKNNFYEWLNNLISKQ